MVITGSIRDWFSQLQTDICSRLEEADGKARLCRTGGGLPRRGLRLGAVLLLHLPHRAARPGAAGVDA